MSGALRRAWAAVRARPGVAAVVCLGIAWGVVMHQMGWAQSGHFAQVRAFAAAQAEIDPWHWDTGDKAWIDGHFYSVKSPGVAALSTPLYVVIEELGGLELARDAALNAREAPDARWDPHYDPPFASHGYDAQRERRVEERVEAYTPVVWALTLLAAVVPSVLLLLAVRWVGERVEPGYGTAAAITLGVATPLLIFGAEFFSHAISAALVFAAFVVLMRERAGPPRLGALAGAGALAGLGVTFEFQVGLVGVVLFFYALFRAAEPRLRRALAYGAGAVSGTVPALAFNAWALGSPFKLAYGDAVSVLGRNGHAELGLNDDGFFGITAPRLEAAVDLLLAGRGLLVLTPIIVMAVVGAFAMRRTSFRAEANVILAVAAAYFVYNAGYWQPFGGGTPAPRFLVPALPFLALGLAVAYRRYTAWTLALAIPSALWMVLASITYPLIGEQGTGLWVDYAADGTLEHTLLTVLGVENAWLAIAPVLAAVAAAVAFAVAATPRTELGPIGGPLLAIAAWVAVSIFGPSIAADPITPLDGSNAAIAWTAIGALVSAGCLVALRYRERAATRVPAPAETELALEPNR